MECYNSNRNVVGKDSITYAGTSGENFTWTEKVTWFREFDRSHHIMFCWLLLLLQTMIHCAAEVSESKRTNHISVIWKR